VLLGCPNHSRKMDLACSRNRSENNTFRVCIFLFAGKTPLLILTRSLEDNIKMYRKNL
jgi:hypothetical protein